VRSYAQFAPTFWTRGSGKDLRGDLLAQALAIYCFTSPHANLTGIYNVALPTIAHELGQSVEDVREAFKRIVDIALYDEAHEMMWVPQHAKHQIGKTLKEADKRRGLVVRSLAQAGNHPFVGQFITLYGEPYGLAVKHAPEGASVGHPQNMDAPSDQTVRGIHAPGYGWDLDLDLDLVTDLRGPTSPDSVVRSAYVPSADVERRATEQLGEQCARGVVDEYRQANLRVVHATQSGHDKAYLAFCERRKGKSNGGLSEGDNGNGRSDHRGSTNGGGAAPESVDRSWTDAALERSKRLTVERAARYEAKAAAARGDKH
jgi:hypothetical protein